jgi:proteasome lid subunit RPN8/RPN11
MNNKIIGKELRGTIRKARKAASDGYREICGLLIDNGHFLEMLETTNVSQKGGHCEFDEKQIKAVMKAVNHLQHEIVGTFHSHPISEAKPGNGDIEGAVDDSLMLIIDCTEGEARLWRIKNARARRVKFKTVEV